MGAFHTIACLKGIRTMVVEGDHQRILGAAIQ
jgi:hypothetical protein